MSEETMLKKHIKITIIILPIALIICFWLNPAVVPILGGIVLICSLAITLYSIFEKHKDTEFPRIKITKDILVFLAIFVLISFVGGVAGLLTNFYVSNLFGAIAGLICAIVIGFVIVIGYLVKRGFQKLIT